MAWLLHDIFHKLCPDEYVKNWRISGNSFPASPFTQSLLWLWLWLWFCWTQKMAWKFWLGENGACFPSCQPSHGPCAPPFIIPSNKIIFASIQSAENWTTIQFFGQPFNSFSPSNDGTGRWRNAGMVSWPSVSLWIPLSHSTIFAKPSTKTSSCKCLKSLRFFHFVPKQLDIYCLCKFHTKILRKYFFTKTSTISTSYNYFYLWSVFGTGHAITYTEHDENLPFTGGVGIGRPEIIPSSVQWGSLWHSVSIRLMIYGNVIAWRTGGLKFPDE